MEHEIVNIAIRLVTAALIGALIGYERRVHHKAIGIAGMVLVAIGRSLSSGLARQPP